jgi:hypothetical protein
VKSSTKLRGIHKKQAMGRSFNLKNTIFGKFQVEKIICRIMRSVTNRPLFNSIQPRHTSFRPLSNWTSCSFMTNSKVISPPNLVKSWNYSFSRQFSSLGEGPVNQKDINSPVGGPHELPQAVPKTINSPTDIPQDHSIEKDTKTPDIPDKVLPKEKEKLPEDQPGGGKSPSPEDDNSKNDSSKPDPSKEEPKEPPKEEPKKEEIKSTVHQVVEP